MQKQDRAQREFRKQTNISHRKFPGLIKKVDYYVFK